MVNKERGWSSKENGNWPFRELHGQLQPVAIKITWLSQRCIFGRERKEKRKKKQGKSKTLAKLPRNQVSQRTMKFKCSMRATARQFNNKSNINRKACQFLRYSLCHVLSSPSTNPFRIVYVLLHRRAWNKNTGRLI